MFGIGAQEMVLIGLLALVIFGPGGLPRMARDLGGFVQKTRVAADDFKSELSFEERRKDPEEDRTSGRQELEGGRKSRDDSGGEPDGEHAQEREPDPVL